MPQAPQQVQSQVPQVPQGLDPIDQMKLLQYQLLQNQQLQQNQLLQQQLQAQQQQQQQQQQQYQYGGRGWRHGGWGGWGGGGWYPGQGGWGQGVAPGMLAYQFPGTYGGTGFDAFGPGWNSYGAYGGIFGSPDVPGGTQGFLAFCQPVVGRVQTDPVDAAGTRTVTFEFMSGGGPVSKQFVASPTHKCYAAKKGELWVVALSTKDLSICPSPEPQFHSSGCKSPTDQAVCAIGATTPSTPTVSCVQWAGMVTNVIDQVPGSKYIVFAFNVGGQKVPKGATATPGTALWGAVVGNVWNVSVNPADNYSICATPVPTLLKAKCASPTELPACAYDPTLPKPAACKPYNGLVQSVTSGPNKTRFINLVFNVNGVPKYGSFTAKPGMDIYDAPRWSVWAVMVDFSKGVAETCADPLPTMTRLRCRSPTDLPPCAFDPNIPTPTPTAAPCLPWNALVLTNPTQQDGTKLITFAFAIPQKDGSRKQLLATFVAKQGTELFNAPVYSVWRVHLDSVTKKVCEFPAPSKIKDKCASATEMPPCAFDPRFDCVPWRGLVLANEAQPGGSRLLTFVFNIGGQRVERTWVAKVGKKAYDAKVGNVWTVHLDAKERTVCDDPEPTLDRAKCNSFTELPPCTFAPTPAPTTPPPSCSTSNREAVPGVIVAKEMPTSTGGCKLVFKYIKDAKTREVAEAEFEVSKDSTRGCLQFNVGQAWAVLRDKVTGEFCGMQQPYNRISDEYCVKPFTALNAEVCKAACVDMQCEPPGCGDYKEPTTGVVLENTETDVPGRRRVVFAYARPNGSIARGFIETSRQDEVRMAAGQAYTVKRDAKSGNFCGLVRPARLVSDNLCDPESDKPESVKRLCQYACQTLKNCPTTPPAPTTPTPGGGGGGYGPNVGVNLRINNQNDGRNDNRGYGGYGGVFGGLVLGPNLYPPGGVWTGADFVPPEKHVFGVPVVENKYVMGTLPSPNDDLLSDAATAKPWTGNTPETVAPVSLTPVAMTTAPDTRGPETRGPETRGPDTRGPDTQGPVASIMQGPGAATFGPGAMMLEDDGPGAPSSACAKYKWFIGGTALLLVVLVLLYVRLRVRGRA
jgi:hypothetical protein